MSTKKQVKKSKIKSCKGCKGSQGPSGPPGPRGPAGSDLFNMATKEIQDLASDLAAWDLLNAALKANQKAEQAEENMCGLGNLDIPDLLDHLLVHRETACDDADLAQVAMDFVLDSNFRMSEDEAQRLVQWFNDALDGDEQDTERLSGMSWILTPGQWAHIGVALDGQGGFINGEQAAAMAIRKFVDDSILALKARADSAKKAYEPVTRVEGPYEAQLKKSSASEVLKAISPIKASHVQVGSILRIMQGDRAFVYQVTGIHLGEVGSEDLVTLRSLTHRPGYVSTQGPGGQVVSETIVPMQFVASSSNVEVIR